MIKKIAIFVVVLALGIGIGFQLPRGAGLIAALTSLGSDSSSDYSLTQSHQALVDLEAMFASGRQMVLDDARTEQEAIEGMRWLLRVLAMSVEVAADGNPTLPYFQRMDTPVRKVGGDNPDAEYEYVQIDGRFDYIIHGNVGTIPYLGFTINGGQGMTPRRQVAYVNDQMLTLDDEGNFTMILAQEKPAVAGDWIEIPEDTSGILVREYIADRSTEILPTLDIEILGDKPAFEPDTDEEIAGAIVGASYAFFKLTTLHKTVLPELLEQKNSFIRVTSETLGGAISSEDNLYMIASYQLADDEALIVQVEPPQTRYWNLALESRWHEVGDYLHRPTSRTMSGVEYRDDGSVEFVIAHQDTGHPNWLDTSGHNFGFMTLRWLDSKGQDVPMPVVKRVKASELK